MLSPAESTVEDSSGLAILLIAIYVVFAVAVVVGVVKAVNATRRWWRRRRGLPDDLDEP